VQAHHLSYVAPAPMDLCMWNATKRLSVWSLYDRAFVPTITTQLFDHLYTVEKASIEQMLSRSPLPSAEAIEHGDSDRGGVVVHSGQYPCILPPAICTSSQRYISVYKDHHHFLVRRSSLLLGIDDDARMIGLRGVKERGVPRLILIGGDGETSNDVFQATESCLSARQINSQF
jgi:hypothetical protein